VGQRLIVGRSHMVERHRIREPPRGRGVGRNLNELPIFTRADYSTVLGSEPGLDKEVHCGGRVAEQVPIACPPFGLRHPVHHRDDLGWLRTRRDSARAPEQLEAVDHPGKRIAVHHKGMHGALAVVDVVEDLHIGVPEVVTEGRERCPCVSEFGEIGIIDNERASPDAGTHRLQAASERV